MPSNLRQTSESVPDMSPILNTGNVPVKELVHSGKEIPIRLIFRSSGLRKPSPCKPSRTVLRAQNKPATDIPAAERNTSRTP